MVPYWILLLFKKKHSIENDKVILFSPLGDKKGVYMMIDKLLIREPYISMILAFQWPSLPLSLSGASQLHKIKALRLYKDL